MKENDNDINKAGLQPAPEADSKAGLQPAPKRRHRWLRVLLWCFLSLILLVILIPVALYIPAVQTWVIGTACGYVKKSSGMDISVEKFRLRWPVDIELRGVTVVEPSGDTMAMVSSALADVKLLPLLKLDFQINRLDLSDGMYRMVSPDSSMILKIKAGYLSVDNQSSADMGASRIDLHKAVMRDGDVSLFMDVWKQKATPADTAASAPFFIKADDLDIENMGFGMSMLPTIDTLRLDVDKMRLRDAVIDLGKSIITARELLCDSGRVTYLVPDSTYLATHPAPETEPSSSAPMIIKGDTVSLNGFDVLYAVKDAEPMEGFDASYIKMTDVNIGLKDFYNEASTVRLPIARLSGKERSGLQIIDGSGLVSIDSTGLALDTIRVATLYSRLEATASLPFALMEMQPNAPVNAFAAGSLGIPDIEAFMPAARSFTSYIPQRLPVDFSLKATGTLDNVSVDTLGVSLPGTASVKAAGKARDVLDMKKMVASLSLTGDVSNPAAFGPLMKDAGFRLPKLALRGHASADHERYAADFRLTTPQGDLAANGKVAMTPETYQADASLMEINVGYFMPESGVGKVTAKLTAKGAGFNPEKKSAVTEVILDLHSLEFQKETLRDIVADITLRDGVFGISADSKNSNAFFHVQGSGTIDPDLYTFDVEGRMKNIDLEKLGFSDVRNNGKGDFSLKGTASPAKWIYDVQARVDSLQWTAGNTFFRLTDPLTLRFNSAADAVNADVTGNMTALTFRSQSGLKPLIDSFTAVGDTVSRQIERRDLNVKWIQQNLPPFTLGLNMSGRGTAGRLLNTMGYSVDTVYGQVRNDSLIGMRLTALKAGNASMTADTIRFGMIQDGELLRYRAHLGNRASNQSLAEFADVNANGYIGSNRLLLSAMQKNQKGETGYRLGFTAAMTDSVVTLHFTPLKATIAYLPWTFNEENYIDYNLLSHHIVADLTAASKESSIRLQTTQGRAGNDELSVAINNVHVQDFLKLSVFAPPITATLGADVRVGYNNNWLYGSGFVNVSDFTYDKLRVGDFRLGMRAGLNNDSTSGARLQLDVDGKKALTAFATLHPDSVTKEQTLQRLSLHVDSFPLYVANPFIGDDMARLSGYLVGGLDVKGTMAEPLLSGAIRCDSVGVYIPMIGTQLRLNDDSIAVADNILRINDFDIKAAGKKNLVINGTVDASRLSAIKFDLTAKGKNFVLFDNGKKAKSDINGKLALDIDASVKGPMDHFNVNADVTVLSGSNVTYNVPSTTATQLVSQDAGDVVKFVNFNDTVAPPTQDSVAPPAMAMRILADLVVQPGVKVTVNIPGTATTGNGKVEMHPSGSFNYFQNFMGDMRLNGSLATGDGFARYSIPVVGEKRFEFNPESNVVFNGDMMNPTLDITATDEQKTNVLQNGNSRMVNFIITLKVTGNLSQPKVTFDLSTDDDMTIQNDLLSMTADQRSMTAMNMLITGQYSVQGVKTASSDLLQGAVYGMLTSQLNSWMANHVKGVDLSFGVDQYDRTVNGETGSAMSYSYQMSKSLFNNKFKIMVGGNYSTDSSSDENLSENLISDISFEYMLKQTTNSTMYVRLFRHTGYESILEGEITETGAGFVLKRRLSNLRDLFRILTFRKEDDSKAGLQPASEESKAGLQPAPGTDDGKKEDEPEKETATPIQNSHEKED